MTVKRWGKKNIRGKRIALSAVILFIFSLLSLILLLCAPSVVRGHMTEALSLCARTVVPSLFPFMVISELLLSGGCAKVISPLLQPTAKSLFGISGESAAAVLIGFICGFPVGAKGAAALYRSGQIGRGELERILTFSCIPSAPFLISTVGISMFGDGRLGARLLISCLLSSVIIGIATKRMRFGDGETGSAPKVAEDEQGIGRLFTSAVCSSALSVLYVCGFLTFFSTLVGVTEYTVRELNIPEQLRPLILGFFELTGGMKEASEIVGAGGYAAAAIGGWSGLSVHFQVMSVCQGCNISFKPYFLSKLASAVLCPVIMMFLELF